MYHQSTGKAHGQVLLNHIGPCALTDHAQCWRTRGHDVKICFLATELIRAGELLNLTQPILTRKFTAKHVPGWNKVGSCEQTRPRLSCADGSLPCSEYLQLRYYTIIKLRGNQKMQRGLSADITSQAAALYQSRGDKMHPVA